jgi:DNA-binding XRE family transcriptional regulator
MLPQALVLEIKRLLDEQRLSQRAIADRLGVSRGTVNNIANGRRGVYGRELPPVERSGAEPSGVPHRCRGCGGLVYQPCLLCRARAYDARRRELRRLFGAARGSSPPPRRAA